MINDALVAFVPYGSPLSLVGAAATPLYSNVFDLLGEGAGQPPFNIIGNAAVFGTDEGVGGKRPELNIAIGTTCTGAAGTTLKIALQAAPDLGSGGGYQPGTWVDIDSQDNIALSNLVSGAVPFRSPFLPTMPPNLLPRYLRLAFTPQTTAAGVTTTPAGNFTAGTIASATVTMVRDDQANKFAARNYSVR